MTDHLASMRAVEQAATSGPWEDFSTHFRNQDSHAVRTIEPGSVVAHTGYGPAGGSCAVNARFIAASRTFVPRALDALDAMQALAEELESHAAEVFDVLASEATVPAIRRRYQMLAGLDRAHASQIRTALALLDDTLESDR